MMSWWDCTVLTKVLQPANEAGRAQLEPGETYRLSALNERLHVCGNEMKRLRTALLSDEIMTESSEMGSLKATTDGNIEAALGREMERLGKDLGRKGGMQSPTGLLTRRASTRLWTVFGSSKTQSLRRWKWIKRALHHLHSTPC
jgi:hypothetical protein